MISQQCFDQNLMLDLGDLYQRALIIFRNYGKNLSDQVVVVLINAFDKNRLPEVLTILEYFYEKYLKDQSPELRGINCNSSTVNPIDRMFKILHLVLGMKIRN